MLNSTSNNGCRPHRQRRRPRRCAWWACLNTSGVRNFLKQSRNVCDSLTFPPPFPFFDISRSPVLGCPHKHPSYSGTASFDSPSSSVHGGIGIEWHPPPPPSPWSC